MIYPQDGALYEAKKAIKHHIKVSHGSSFDYLLNKEKQAKIRIDKKHLKYWEECIETSYKPVDLSTEGMMIPEKVRGAFCF